MSNLDRYPTISVVMPCHNSGPWIKGAITSVLSEEYPGLDLVVIDDGSTDDSLNVINSFGGLLRSESGPNRGACAARNRGLQLAHGEYVVFMDSDDQIEHGFLHCQANVLRKKRVDIVFGESKLKWPDGRILEKAAMPLGVSHDHALALVLSAGWHPPHAILWNKAFCRRIGGWDERLTRNQDGDYIARGLLNEPSFCSSTGKAAIYLQHESSARISSRKDARALKSSLLVARKVHNALATHPTWERSRVALGQSLSETARQAYEMNYPELGRASECFARRLGFSGNRGSFLHRALCRLIGLERKVAVSRWLHQ